VNRVRFENLYEWMNIFIIKYEQFTLTTLRQLFSLETIRDKCLQLPQLNYKYSCNSSLESIREQRCYCDRTIRKSVNDWPTDKTAGLVHASPVLLLKPPVKIKEDRQKLRYRQPMRHHIWLEPHHVPLSVVKSAAQVRTRLMIRWMNQTRRDRFKPTKSKRPWPGITQQTRQVRSELSWPNRTH